MRLPFPAATRKAAFALAVAALAGAHLGASREAASAAGLAGARGGMRDARYCELFVVRRKLSGPDVSVYNTLGLNDCPQQAWKRIDPAALKREFKAAAVVTNGPRYFLMDSSSFEVAGDKATFDGLDMRLVAHIVLPRGSFLPWKKREPYTETTIRRTTRWTYLAGRPVYRLTAPGGKAYVMQSYSQIVDPHLTQASLPALATRLKLPPGWTFGATTPRATLNLQTQGGVAHVIQDDLENTYQRVNSPRS